MVRERRKREVVVKDDATTEELLSPDIWHKDLCGLCHEEAPSREQKIAHSKAPKHAKRVAIFKFLGNEASNHAAPGRASRLAEWYEDKAHEAVGLDTISELVFPFAESGWWACSICYDAGFNYDQVDEHLNSARHLKTFVEEFHPAKAKKMDKDWSQTERLEFLLEAKKQIYYEESRRGAEKPVPEVIDLSAWTLLVARKRLGVDDTQKEYAVVPVGEDGTVLIQCQTCHETIPCRKEYVPEGWTIHQATERHKRMVALNAILRQYHFERVQEEDRLLTELSEETVRWKRVDDRVYGPVCGIKHLRRMGSTSICALCGVIADGVDEHFASEHHLIRFVSTQSPRDAWQMAQAFKEARRERLLAMIQGATRENEESRATQEACPSRLTWLAVESDSERELYTPPSPEVFGYNSTCLQCRCCWQCLPIPAGEDAAAVWNEHVLADEHLDFAARRYTMNYDDAYVVPLASSVTLLPKDPHGKWATECQMEGEAIAWKYQMQTDVGLEYVIEDADQGLAVCTLCARSYPLGEKCQMGRHVRTVQHLQQYLHVADRAMLSMVLDTKKEADADELILEYIARNRVSGLDEIRVFNKKKAKELEAWPRVKERTMQITSFEPDFRPIYECISSIVDRVANDKEEERTESARVALHNAGMKEIPVTRGVLLRTGLSLFRCSTCEMCFVVKPSQLEHDVWEKHLASEQHRDRTLALVKYKFAPLYFMPTHSTYTVKPFVQKDPTKKVTWRWNAKDKTHELVLAVVGLEELVEKKSEDWMVMNDTGADYQSYVAHFFCRVCAVVIGRRAQLLEDHVRSAAHVCAYVNKHYPQTVLELERLDNNDGGKEMRKILAQLLKDVKPAADYPIAVYNPVGETERRQSEAEVKRKQREAMIKNEEMRQKAMEERKKVDEAKQKRKEEEAKREKEREEVRKQREAAVLERAAALAAEREHMQKLAIEQAAAAEAARKAQERTVVQNQLTRDPAIAALLNERQAITSQLEALRAAKASAGSVPEPRLLIPGPNQLSAVPVSTAAAVAVETVLPTVRITGGPIAPLPAPFAPLPNTALPPPGMFAMPPPSMNVPPPVSSVPLNPFSLPPPSMLGMPGVPGPLGMSAPPPGFTPSTAAGGPLPDLVGPKPVLSTFVPKVDAMPVYPMTPQAPAPGIRTLTSRPDFERRSLAGAAPDMFATNAAIITNRQSLVDYMWKQGTEEAPEGERPARFSRLCAATPACLGMEYIYEVVCLDAPDLTTMYCSMCAYWSTPSDTLKHMLTAAHRMSYLFRNYKVYHKSVEGETDPRQRENLLEQFATQIRSRDNPPPAVTHRLKCYLNAATIQRLWPAYVTVLDQTWRANPVCRTPSPQRRRHNGRSRSRSYSSDSRSRSYSRSRSPSPSRGGANRYGGGGRRSRSRERDNYGRRRDVSRSRSRSPRGRNGSSRRARSRSYSRSRSGTPVQNKTWLPESMGVGAAASGSSMMTSSSSSMMSSMTMMGASGAGAGRGLGMINTSVPPPLNAYNMMMPNMSVPPPQTPTKQQPKQPTVITVDSDDDMQIATTPPPSAEKKKTSASMKETDRRGGDRDKERDRGDRGGRKEDSKSSTPRRDRSRSRDRGGSRRDSGASRRDKDGRKEEVDPVREEQRKKVLEKLKDIDREKRKMRERDDRGKKENDRDKDRVTEKRRRSPSPARKRRRSDSRERRRSGSRERRSSHRSSNGGGGEGGEKDWDSKAAAFLAKIGDLQGASRLIQPGVATVAAVASAWAAAGSVGSSAPPIYTGPPPSAATAAVAARPTSGMGGGFESPRIADFGAAAVAAAQSKRRQEEAAISPDYEPLMDEGPSYASRLASSMGGGGGAAPKAAPIVDDDVEMKRKLLGAISAMNKETEAGRDLNEADIDRIYAEMGIPDGRTARTERLICELMESMGGRPGIPVKKINLMEYGIAPGASPAAAPQHHGSPYYGGPGGPSSSRGGPPPAGYGSSGGYGSSPPRRDARAPIPGLGGIDAGDIELLKNLRSTLAMMATAPSSSGARSLPMPSGFGRPPPGAGDYDRREAYPPYRSPAEEDPRMRRPQQSPYDDPRDRYMDPRDRPDPRDRYMDPRGAPDPRSAAAGYGRPPPQRDDLRGYPPPQQQQAPPPRGGYYDDPYEQQRQRVQPAPGGSYGAPPGYGSGGRMDPRDAPPRGDPHAPAARPPPLGNDSRLYEPPPQRAERPVLTREEYEARLRGEIPPSQPTGSAAPKPAAAAAAQTAAPAAKKQQDVVTLDDDDDWGSLEQMLDSKAPPPAAAAASKKPAAPKNGPQQAAAAAAASPAAPPMTAAEAEKEAARLRHQEGFNRARAQWGVRNKATPAAQPHLGPPPPEPERIGFKEPQEPEAAWQQSYGVPTGGQWDAAPPQRQPQQQHQQQQYQQPAQQHYPQQQQEPYPLMQQQQQQRQYPPQHLQQPQQPQQQQQQQQHSHQGYFNPSYGHQNGSGGAYNGSYGGGGGYY